MPHVLIAQNKRVIWNRWLHQNAQSHDTSHRSIYYESAGRGL